MGLACFTGCSTLKCRPRYLHRPERLPWMMPAYGRGFQDRQEAG
jgi:hypothetical protein